MSLTIALELADALPTLARAPERDVQEGELVEVLAAQCHALAEAGGVEFRVGGFGDPHWRVDVSTDLAIALEQLPEVVRALREEGRSFQLNFFEQGIECYLTGARCGSDVIVECATMRMNWTPDPRTETVPLAELQRMLREVAERYSRAVDAVCPWLAKMDAFLRWKEAILWGQ